MGDYIGNRCLDIISLFLHFKVKITVPVHLYICTPMHCTPKHLYTPVHPYTPTRICVHLCTHIPI